MTPRTHRQHGREAGRRPGQGFRRPQARLAAKATMTLAGTVSSGPLSLRGARIDGDLICINCSIDAGTSSVATTQSIASNRNRRNTVFDVASTRDTVPSKLFKGTTSWATTSCTSLKRSIYCAV